jgi:hypothetical protein
MSNQNTFMCKNKNCKCKNKCKLCVRNRLKSQSVNKSCVSAQYPAKLRSCAKIKSVSVEINCILITVIKYIVYICKKKNQFLFIILITITYYLGRDRYRKHRVGGKPLSITFTREIRT